MLDSEHRGDSWCLSWSGQNLPRTSRRGTRWLVAALQAAERAARRPAEERSLCVNVWESDSTPWLRNHTSTKQKKKPTTPQRRLHRFTVNPRAKTNCWPLRASPVCVRASAACGAVQPADRAVEAAQTAAALLGSARLGSLPHGAPASGPVSYYRDGAGGQRRDDLMKTKRALSCRITRRGHAGAVRAEADGCSWTPFSSEV